MYATTEVRWFLPGAVPDATARWFAALGAPVEEARRADRYLVPSGPGEPGIKLREGAVEVKARTAVRGEQRFGPAGVGTVEAFRKWSFPLAPEAPTPGTGWVDIAKARRVRTFVLKSGALREADAMDAERGCGVELGEVRLGERIWWTLCLEAFGPGEAARRNVFEATAAHVFGVGAPVLEATHSRGYVGWLCEVSADGG